MLDGISSPPASFWRITIFPLTKAGLHFTFIIIGFLNLLFTLHHLLWKEVVGCQECVSLCNLFPVVELVETCLHVDSVQKSMMVIMALPPLPESGAEGICCECRVQSCLSQDSGMGS
ncbi:unnamed protein product [Rangifer tarandus platyrhynchus]|uniref:Uncharacterized protein n=2 Tax=Rangifer tarandus platyrhynchus TaxID=3082113 RepID=A0AC59Y8M3_RANTA|nr:unnamed protein product [Rangifer tarandus platyrhynchus]